MAKRLPKFGLLFFILVFIPGCQNFLGNLLNPTTPEPDPISLNDVFKQAALLEWNADSAQITDTPQSAIADFYFQQIGQDILPRWYLNERWFQLGPLTAGDVLKIELLSELVDGVLLYGDDYTVLANWARDFNGSEDTLEVLVPRDQSNAFLRLNLAYLSDKGQPIVRVSRKTSLPAPTPVPQTVVLNFAGKDFVTFRSGYVLPTTVGDFDGSEADRNAAVEAFASAYEQYNIQILTDTDPTPSEPYSVIHIGTVSPVLGSAVDGTSEFIDWQNAHKDDVAIIDVHSDWLIYLRVFYPELYGRAIGRIAAHEMGHLLGLVHVTDADDIMKTDAKGTGVAPLPFLERQFKKSAIAEFYLDSDNPDTWTIGYQDAPAYFLQILGPKFSP